MRLSRKVEIQPTPTQRNLLLHNAGAARWAYNWGLARKNAAWAERKAALEAGVSPESAPKVPTAIDLHRELVVLKNTPRENGGVPWMYEVSKCAPQEALRNLDRAFQHFFRRIKLGEKPGHPKFKSRKRRIGGFRLTGSVKANHKSIQLPKIGCVRIKPGDHGYLPLGKYAQVSVTEHAGRWYVSILCTDVTEAAPNNGSEVGIDVGVVRLATLSDGTVIENPKTLARWQHKIRRAAKEVSRKKKGGKNRNRAREKLARVHARAANARMDALHKATTMLAKSHGRIVIEDLSVRNMTRSASGRGKAAKAGLNRSLLDASFAEFRRQLEYKAKLYGCRIIVVPAAYTSQRCSSCGYIDADNRISQGDFRCLGCGHTANADLNAAVNIRVAGSCPETLNACGAGVRRGDLKITSQLAKKQESAWS